jgi:histidinol dehydrogenase
MDEAARRAWLGSLRPAEPETDVSEIIAAIRDRGDAALRELTARLDGVDLVDAWVSADERDAAIVEPGLEKALATAAASIERYHAEQRNALRQERRVRTAPGITAWRRWQPIERVGGYVPGGRAAYASSVLMLAVPARLAGVDELIIATPPGPDGCIAPAVLVAARIGGVGSPLPSAR